MYSKLPQLMCSFCGDMRGGLYNQLFKILVINVILLAGREEDGGCYGIKSIVITIKFAEIMKLYISEQRNW